MRLPRVRFTVRTMMLAVAAAGISLVACTRAIEAYDAYLFRKGWATRDVVGLIKAVNREEGTVSMTLGMDDGLCAGDDVYIYREEPEIRYIGQARVVTVTNEWSVGLIAARPRGVEVHVGDQVARFSWDHFRRLSLPAGCRRGEVPERAPSPKSGIASAESGLTENGTDGL
ncbi:hypothetical protein OJF2_41090 [Aquisphaera giovannonii]|uniref:Uncharacterized protein n=1 Tax=Aquisphaera giovannonii TaxID=406548 RepID=A0A5B9W4J3_9BACT|nr:hypothetical protein [Aquisphaera giovannonii]QEH35556.1 hypothetical protein OJF2_41090 [Aquisphaera giovannonii]